jgi:glucokinase
MLTLGTGIGSGFVIDGRVLHGAHDMAGEAGHMIVAPGGRLCGCGQRGCLEAYASAPATVKRAVEALAAGEHTSLAQIWQGGTGTITAKDVFDAARDGDRLASRIAEETATFLGLACVSLCRVLDPQMIVFAGGMILAGESLFERVRKAFREQSWNILEDQVQIVPATLGNDAGFIGAAAVAWDAARSGKPA